MSAKLKKDKREPVRIQLKKNDQVKVIAGRDRGKTGRILDVDSSTGRIFVEHVNMVKRHTKKNPAKKLIKKLDGLRVKMREGRRKIDLAREARPH